MSESDKLIFTTAKFGEITVEKTSVVTFPEGVPGFECHKKYGLVSVEEEAPFLRLLSIDEPTLGFVMLNPMTIWPDYSPQVPEDGIEGLEVQSPADIQMYCIVTLSSVPQEVTANLKGPIVINMRTMMARQLILIDDRYQTKHSLLSASTETVESQ